jgi:hypothetical protein
LIHSGSCLCGRVRYELLEEPFVLANCHCSICRKSHGAAFVTHAVVPETAFRIVDGAADLGGFPSSPGYMRMFCRTCGSRLFERTPRGIVSVAAGTLDTTPEGRPGLHFFVADKAPWFQISDDLPQFAQEPGEPGAGGGRST